MSCLTADRLEALVAMWLGQAHVATDARVHVRTDADDEQQARIAELVIERGTTQTVRRFDPLPASCDEAHAAVSLVIALAIEPDLIDDVLGQAPAPQREPIAIDLTLQLAGASALLPNWSLGAAFGVQAWFAPWLGARAELLAQHARNNTVGDTAGQFDATLIAADLRACAGGKPGSGTRIALCTGAAVGAMNARGRSYERSYSPTGFWLGITSGLRLELDAGLPWLLDVTAVLPLRADPFTVARAGGDEAARQPSSAALLIALGSRISL